MELISLTKHDDDLLKKHFGITNNCKVAGYLLKDGTMLDFSGKHWGCFSDGTRTVDHRDVWDVWENPNRNGIDEMVNMIANGNIRLMPEIGGINLAVPPTETQQEVLSSYIQRFKGEVIVDYDKLGADTVYSKQYPIGTRPEQVLHDIMHYFSTKTISELMQFHLDAFDEAEEQTSFNVSISL